MYDSPAKHPRISQEERKYIEDAIGPQPDKVMYAPQNPPHYLHTQTPPSPNTHTQPSPPPPPNTHTLRWRHNGHVGVSNHQPHHCLLNRLFGRRSKKTSKLRVTGLCVGNSPVTGEFPAQMASNAENVSIWWRHHDTHTRTLPLLPVISLDNKLLTMFGHI